MLEKFESISDPDNSEPVLFGRLIKRNYQLHMRDKN